MCIKERKEKKNKHLEKLRMKTNLYQREYLLWSTHPLDSHYASWMVSNKFKLCVPPKPIYFINLLLL